MLYLIPSLTLFVAIGTPILLDGALLRPLKSIMTIKSIRLAASREDDAGAARAMLFDDQHRAMGQEAEAEGKTLDPNMREMKVLSSKKRKQQRKQHSAGVGFGGKGPVGLSKPEQEIQMLAAAVQEDGVVLVPKVLQKQTAAAVRECLVAEIEHMRDAIRNDPSLSVSLFYVPAHIHFSTPRGYVLLPFRDTESVLGGNPVGSLVSATRELLSPEAPLSGLFGTLCDGQASQLYDFCALRTDPGAARQVVHSDTPYQEVPGLFCAFIALQDVTMEMGGTMFVPKTHLQTKERREFDTGDKATMLKNAKPLYTKLQQGDAAVFDMRTLHAGLANLLDGGAERILMAITFRNLKAKGDLGHKPNLRPNYVGKYTLGSLQDELASTDPFADAGNGIAPRT